MWPRTSWSNARKIVSAASWLAVIAILTLISSSSTHASVPISTEPVPGLLAQARTEGAVRVIVGLDTDFTPEGALGNPQAVEAQRRELSRVQKEVLSGLGGLGVERVVHYHFIPYLALTVDARALEALAAFPEVSSIEANLELYPSLLSSTAVIAAPDAWAKGFTGQGQVVAVLDTGVDKTHPYFAAQGKVVSEACYSTTLPAESLSSVCPGGVASSTEAGSGVNCPLEIAGCDHGTHVAGIAVGNDEMGPRFGVARDADLIAIQVFSRRDDPTDCGMTPTPCSTSRLDDLLLGLQRVDELADTFGISVANLSLGGGGFAGACDAVQPSIKDAIDSLQAKNVATVIAAGNDGLRDKVSFPACISSAVSVGATDDADAVASFSNLASFVSLLAPGVSIDSSVPGGGLATFDGTSQAAPHVAGAWAVLRQRRPLLSVAEILDALRVTGTLVDDQRMGGVVTDLPRIDLNRALAHICLPDAFEPDDSAGEASALGSGISQLHNICPVGEEDWATFSLPGASTVTLETFGLQGDTRMWLRSANGAQIEFNDDGGFSFFSSIDRECGVDALPPGSYLVQVDEFGDNDDIPLYGLSLDASPCPCAADLVLADQTLTGTQGHQASTTLTLGPNLVADGEDIAAHAPTVVLTSGTVIGGRFRAGNQPVCP